MPLSAKPKKGRILVVEDDWVILEVLKLMLEDEGHEVTTAKHGRAALATATAAAKPFDVVVLDISMPEMSGIEVAEALRANDKTADVGIVVHTGLDEHWVRERFEQYDVFLTKAEDADVLVGEIARLIGEPPAPGRHRGAVTPRESFSSDEVAAARSALRAAMALGPEALPMAGFVAAIAVELEQMRKLGHSSADIAALLSQAVGRPIAAGALEDAQAAGPVG